MLDVLTPPTADASALLLYVVGLVILGLQVWALVDACVRPTGAYVAADKLTKAKWVGILVVGLLLGLRFGGLGLLGLLGLVAAIVYLVDVRPAVRSLRPGGPWG